MIKRIPPAPIGVDAENNALKIAFPIAEDNEILLPDDLLPRLEKYRELKEEIKEKIS